MRIWIVLVVTSLLMACSDNNSNAEKGLAPYTLDYSHQVSDNGDLEGLWLVTLENRHLDEYRKNIDQKASDMISTSSHNVKFIATLSIVDDEVRINPCNESFQINFPSPPSGTKETYLEDFPTPDTQRIINFKFTENNYLKGTREFITHKINQNILGDSFDSTSSEKIEAIKIQHTMDTSTLNEGSVRLDYFDAEKTSIDSPKTFKITCYSALRYKNQLSYESNENSMFNDSGYRNVLRITAFNDENTSLEIDINQFDLKQITPGIITPQHYFYINAEQINLLYKVNHLIETKLIASQGYNFNSNTSEYTFFDEMMGIIRINQSQGFIRTEIDDKDDDIEAKILIDLPL